MRSVIVSERKDLSYVTVFLCQVHQLRGICLRSLVITNSMLEAIRSEVSQQYDTHKLRSIWVRNLLAPFSFASMKIHTVPRVQLLHVC